MAKSMEAIQIDFSRAVHASEELEALAQNIEALAQNKLDGTWQSLGQKWTGAASREYLRKGKILENKIFENGKQLKETAKAIRTAAKAIYDAEMEALRLAEIRKG